MNGFEWFKNEFQMQARAFFKCEKMPRDLARVFSESPSGLRAYYERLHDLPTPECLESYELDSCNQWENCDHLSECARGYVGRLAAGWSWALSENTEDK